MVDQTGNGAVVFQNTPTLITPKLTSPDLTTPTLTTPTITDPTVSGLILGDGQIKFPATQNPSSDVNTLDDYEEGTWTPVFTFASPGDLAITYSLQNATYTKIGRLVSVGFVIISSAFTWSTASGNGLITGLPFASKNNANYRANVALLFQGITKASYTDFFGVVVGNASQLLIIGSGSSVAAANAVAADFPSGGSVVLEGSFSYIADS